jgi:hypothetical protein
MLASFGHSGPLQLAEPEPPALCSALERLLDDGTLQARLAAAGPALVSERTWRRAAGQLQDALRGSGSHVAA